MRKLSPSIGFFGLLMIGCLAYGDNQLTIKLIKNGSKCDLIAVISEKEDGTTLGMIPVIKSDSKKSEDGAEITLDPIKYKQDPHASVHLKIQANTLNKKEEHSNVFYEGDVSWGSEVQLRIASFGKNQAIGAAKIIFPNSNLVNYEPAGVKDPSYYYELIKKISNEEACS